MAVLEAHELLNAAGRAGRAGEQSQGFVLVVPSRVIHFDEQTGNIDRHWGVLRKIFEQADQCLTIEDPLVAILDNIHDGAINHGMSAYLLSKLPVSVGDEPDAAAKTMLARSFAARRAAVENKQDWIDSRINAALAARAAAEHALDEPWLEVLAGSTGVSVSILKSLEELLDSGNFDGSNAVVAIDALLEWVSGRPETLLDLVRPENLDGLFGGAYTKLQSDEERGQHVLPTIRKLLPLWMSGIPLSEIERAHLGIDNIGLCKYARHFVLRVVPDLAFIAGLPSRLLNARAKSQQDENEPIPAILTVLETLQAIVREGCDSPETLASRLNLGRDISRVKARERHAAYLPYIPVGDPYETFEATQERLRSAAAITALAEN
jgi:hypothetical protein